MIPKSKQMEFFNMYRGLDDSEKNTLRKAIINTTGIEHSTFYSWLRRGGVPKPKDREAIAKLLQKTEQELFPDEYKAFTESVSKSLTEAATLP